jgi:nucleotide-binding universal stress UspA family protein
MKAKKIVFPTDFSSSSDAALRYATVLARDTGAELIIVHVHEPAAAYAAGDVVVDAAEASHETLTELLVAVVPPDRDVPHRHQLLYGDPIGQIVRLAEDEDADMIVMGTHGRTGLTRLVVGSVAEAVVRRAGCPVLIVKHARHSHTQVDGGVEDTP